MAHLQQMLGTENKLSSIRDFIFDYIRKLKRGQKRVKPSNFVFNAFQNASWAPFKITFHAISNMFHALSDKRQECGLKHGQALSLNFSPYTYELCDFRHIMQPPEPQYVVVVQSLSH